MQIFNLTLNQMLMMFLLIMVGFILRKYANIPENAGTVMAKLETYIFVPALSFYTQITKCTVENFAKHSPLILYGLVVVLAAIGISYPLSRFFPRIQNPIKEISINMH